MINPALVDVTLPFDSGYPDDLADGDTRDVLWDVCGSASREFPQSMWIEPREWVEFAKEKDANKTWATNYHDRFSNQGPDSHECTCHSLVACMEIARNRALGIIYPEGATHNYRYPQSAKSGSVWLSPLSVYSEANPRQWGGAGVRQVLEIAVRRGVLPDKTQPASYQFKHTLHGTTGNGNNNQSSGRWVRLSDFPEGWQETAQWFVPDEIVFPESYEQAVCLVLHDCAVGVGRRGHAVPWMKWRWQDRMMEYDDSYNVRRYDSEATVKSAWRGSYAVITTKLSSDRTKPAGV